MFKVYIQKHEAWTSSRSLEFERIEVAETCANLYFNDDEEIKKIAVCGTDGSKFYELERQ